MKAPEAGRLSPALPRADAEAREPDLDSIGDRVFRIPAVLAIVAAGVVTLGAIVNHFAFDDAIPDLNVKLEISLNNWLTVVASFGGGFAVALYALVFPVRRVWFAILAAALILFSLDDLVRIHERLGDRIGVDHIETAIFAPVYGAVFLIIWALAREVSPRAGRLLRLGLVLLVAAVVVDLGSTVTPDLEAEGTVWPEAIRVAVEEGLEVAGWVLVSATLTTLLCLALVLRARDDAPEGTADGPKRRLWPASGGAASHPEVTPRSRIGSGRTPP